MSACADALVLIEFAQMISSNYTSFGVAVNSGWCWDLIQWRTLAILTGRELALGLLASRKETLYVLAQCT